MQAANGRLSRVRQRGSPRRNGGMGGRTDGQMDAGACSMTSKKMLQHPLDSAPSCPQHLVHTGCCASSSRPPPSSSSSTPNQAACCAVRALRGGGGGGGASAKHTHTHAHAQSEISCHLLCTLTISSSSSIITITSSSSSSSSQPGPIRSSRPSQTSHRPQWMH